MCQLSFKVTRTATAAPFVPLAVGDSFTESSDWSYMATQPYRRPEPDADLEPALRGGARKAQLAILTDDGK